MATQFLPEGGNWTQPNNGGGSVEVAFNVDFEANRGKARVSKPLLQLFNDNDTLGDGSIDGFVNSVVRYDNEYWAMSDTLFRCADSISVNLFDKDNWEEDDISGSPSFGNSNGQAVVWDGKLMVIDNLSSGRIDAYNGSSWSNYLASSGATINKTIGDVEFMVPAKDGNLYIVDEDGYIHRLNPDGTANWSTDSSPANEGTLDFSAYPYRITCFAASSSRLFFGFQNTDSAKGGVIEWDMGKRSVAPNRIHELSAVPRCMAVWNDIVVAIMSDGSVKYNQGGGFTDFPGMHLPKIDGRYDDDFIHYNGWDIIDNMPHFLIKGGKSLSAFGTSSQDKDFAADINFPSAVYCLDPEVGFYPRFALTTSTSTTDSNYSLPVVNNVGALRALEEDGSKFFASYDVYTDNTGTNIGVFAHHDASNSRDSKGFILFNEVERANPSKTLQLLHRVMKPGNSVRAFYQEYEEDEQAIEGVWSSTTTFNTTDTTIDVDDKWLAWVKTGGGAGQFLRVDSMVSSTGTRVVTFKDENTFVSVNDETVIQFIKFRYFGKADSETKDFTPLSFPSGANTRQVKVLYELTQASGTINEIGYTVVDT